MLGLGWTEMLVISVAALIFIGPKDLPVVMNRVGKIVGQIRRMGNEFQREINKTTGLDEVRNLRNSITAPLKKTSEEIRREFNTMTPTGPKPSGVIKPTDPKVESVVDEIRARAGMTEPAPVVAAPAAGETPLEVQPPAEAPPMKKPVKAEPSPTRPVVTTELPALDAVPAPAESQPIDMDPPVKKPRTRKPAAKKNVLPTEPADSPAAPTPKARTSRKPKPDTTQAGNE
ncbi:Sec-independent protein translocase protein TatB [Devosia submarina]|uniref:Sec-independent protein translocase protein TatB n=1 Tax=Devosia submarina TaxID=1173082 RepID=UPI000D392E18|nr:Sec-independent protein translocase protein TatB [Devosia submarina]